MPPKRPDATVIGGGLAGCEAAWQLAERGLHVDLVDMKPASMSPAHQTPLLCELVCSNSLRSDDETAPAGLLKAELRALGSMVIEAARQCRVPAGSALAVNRFSFGRRVTTNIALHKRIRLLRYVIDELPEGPTIVATGPLTGGRLAQQISGVLGGDHLHFYDAIAPIVSADSVAQDASFRASRWGKSEVMKPSEAPDGDYINCPLTEREYQSFMEAVLAARKVEPKAFEEPKYFEGCLPIEVMASRGFEVLRHGPMRPVGLVDPRTNQRPYAVVQLRPENNYRTAYNLVGFQTRLAYPEQRRVFSLIPALRDAEFLRFGSIHRNTYIDSPRLLGPHLELRSRPDLYFGGLLTGVEGYIESCAMGLLAARFLAGRLAGRQVTPPPPTTALGGLYHHVTHPREVGQVFAPTNINYGLLPRLKVRVRKRERRALLAERARLDLSEWLDSRTCKIAVPC